MKFTSLALIFAILKISLNLLDEKFGLSEQCHNQLICFASLSICAYKLSVICISKTKIPVIHDSVC
jgi:Ca2+/H+ antiporter